VDQLAGELAQHDYSTDQQALARIEAIHTRLEEVPSANQQLLEQNSALLQRLGATPGNPSAA
jgi:hypothetical protein